MTKYRIPVRVVRPPVAPRSPGAEAALHTAASEKPIAASPDSGEAQVEGVAHRAASSADAISAAVESEGATGTKARHITETEERERAYRSSEDEDWRARALRLQAEMATYRRRQQRAAQEAAQTEQRTLLKDVLVVADNLDRALDAARGNGQERRAADPQHAADSLAEGVQLTRSALQRTLIKHGLERISVKGKPFDPAWHEAVYVVPAATLDVEPGTVVEVLEAGYCRQGALFRPAKVVVAQ